MSQYSVTEQYDDLIGHYQAGSLGALGAMLGGVSGISISPAMSFRKASMGCSMK